MKRTQLYLDEDVWKALHIQSRQSGKSISELIRETLREKYKLSLANRKRVMQGWVGVWKDRDDLPATETYLRQLRKGTRRTRGLGL
jgi:hypothetical protein